MQLKFASAAFEGESQEQCYVRVSAISITWVGFRTLVYGRDQIQDQSKLSKEHPSRLFGVRVARVQPGLSGHSMSPNCTERRNSIDRTLLTLAST